MELEKQINEERSKLNEIVIRKANPVLREQFEKLKQDLEDKDKANQQ